MASRATWLRMLADAKIGTEDSAQGWCPNCGCEQLRARYIADPESRLGYALFWCTACLHGISVSRARAPEGVPVRPIGDPASTVGVPDFQREE